MNGRVLRTFAVLNALLFCLLTVSGQEPKVASSESLNSLRELAAKGEVSAQFNLGFMYANGQGVTQDYVEAVRWYRKAADQEDAAAQYNLGIRYDNGQGVTQDYVLAHMWLNLSASNSSGDDRKRTAIARDAVAAKMTPAQIAEAQRLAREWKPKRVESKDR